MKSSQESWQQDPYETDLWHGANGLIVNTAALEERSYYVNVVRLTAPLPLPLAAQGEASALADEGALNAIG